MRWYFVFFLLSGFCSILYELIWLRLAMAHFGVTTPLVSIVLSTFMAGLGISSWLAGFLVRKYGARLVSPPLRFYALCELFVACSALLVPLEMSAGRSLTEKLGSSMSLSSSGYYFVAGVWLAFTLIPWCACMGATIPLAMFAIRSDNPQQSRRSFSFLYLANVSGAVAGALLPLVLIEILGFTGTLRCGIVLNLFIFLAAFVLSSRQTNKAMPADQNRSCEHSGPGVRSTLTSGTLWLLLLTGLTSMGMEVVWTRQYTPFVGTFVYSFAAILAIYLAATFIGSSIYRVWSRRHARESALVWLSVWLASLIPALTADPRLDLDDLLRVPLGIALFSGLLGFLTPMLVDRFSQGDPDRAGVGYAVNVVGCIVGPVLAGFVLLPHVDERRALVVLALPWLVIGSARLFRRVPVAARPPYLQRLVGACVVGLSLVLIFATQTFDRQFPGVQIRRDSTATVLAWGTGMSKHLIVNGTGMTVLTPITKLMASLPLALLDRPPQNALVICFGMGTTHRSVISWGIDSTAVELVPSVPQVFSYYHADGADVLKSPHSHVVIDDGRRFLERASGQYDVIVIDPPPPVQAAGSSLLYSREFYALAKARLNPDGILQQWLPHGDPAATTAVVRALKESFPYVRAFVSIEGWGVHLLASQQPIPERSAADLAKRLPPNAAADLVEFGPFATPEQQFAAVLKNEVPISKLITNPYSPALTDDRPANEYDLLRQLGAWLYREQWNSPPDPEQ